MKTITWVHEKGDSYLVTGVDCSGRRFSRNCQNWLIADSINIWRGTKWLIRNGKKIKLQTVYN